MTSEKRLPSGKTSGNWSALSSKPDSSSWNAESAIFHWITDFGAARRPLIPLLCLATIALLMWTSRPASATSPVAVIRSEKNAQSYADQHLGNFDDDWLSFRHALETANLRYDTLSDEDTTSASSLTPYKVVVVPLLTDLPPKTVSALSDFVKSGGKLMVTDGGGTSSPPAETVIRLAGAEVSQHLSMTGNRKLVWQEEPQPVSQEFPVGTVVADARPAEGAHAVGFWQDASGANQGTAVVAGPGTIYLSWAPGVQGEISANASLLSLALEELVPGITQQAAVQISFADYQTITHELEYLNKRTDEAINTAKQADLAVPFKTIQANYESALAHVLSFHDSYKNREFYRANDELAKARQEFSLAYAKSMPVRPVEARCLWLDRGTIIATKNPSGMAQLFDKLKATGINTVYFETNNAGFAMYPSHLAQQNPGTLGWDPLATAVKEAHKRGIELHAWFWIFAVGNIRHNPIVGRPADYPGPVLSTHDLTWALTSHDGAFLPRNQPEFWLDPANPEARRWVENLIQEVVDGYSVDGVQYDYVRYPFNNRGTEMGFDWVGRSIFENDTGLSLDRLTDETRRVWRAWKIQQVNRFVRDTSTMIRERHPGLRISAAVYAMPRRLRLNAIQQEWETWVINGWVDTINPMTYVVSASDLSQVAGYAREAAEDKALVYPGLSIRQLDAAGLVEQLDTSRAIGTLGTTMFAAAQLDDNKQTVLRLGPYRKHTILTPQSHPIRASRLLIDDFAAMVRRYLQAPHKHILSDQSTTNTVLTEIMQLQHQLHRLPENASADAIDAVDKEVTDLYGTVKDWLRLEAFIQRGFRAQYIANYLSQVEAILSYASHRAKSQAQLAGLHPGLKPVQTTR